MAGPYANTENDKSEINHQLTDIKTEKDQKKKQSLHFCWVEI